MRTRNIFGLSEEVKKLRIKIRLTIKRRLKGQLWKYITKDRNEYQRIYMQWMRRPKNYYLLVIQGFIQWKNIKEKRIFTIRDRVYLKKVNQWLFFN